MKSTQNRKFYSYHFSYLYEAHRYMTRIDDLHTQYIRNVRYCTSSNNDVNWVVWKPARAEASHLRTKNRTRVMTHE